MRRWVIALMSFLCQSILLAQASDAGAVKEAIARLEKGDRQDLKVSIWKDSSRVAIEFMDEVPHIKDNETRSVMTEFAVQLERYSLNVAEGHYVRSQNKELRDRLIRVAIADSSVQVKESALNGLRDLFAPSSVDSSAGEFRKQIQEMGCSVPGELVFYYASLPSADPITLKSVVSKCAKGGGNYWTDAVLAKSGDAQAEGRVLAASRSVSGLSGAMLNELIDSLALLESPSALSSIAIGLRDESYLKLNGRDMMPRRQIFAGALAERYRDTETFPVKVERWEYSEVELTAMEEWCMKNLGVKYANAPRKKIEWKREWEMNRN